MDGRRQPLDALLFDRLGKAIRRGENGQYADERRIEPWHHLSFSRKRDCRVKAADSTGPAGTGQERFSSEEALLFRTRFRRFAFHFFQRFVSAGGIDGAAAFGEPGGDVAEVGTPLFDRDIRRAKLLELIHQQNQPQ